MDYIAQMMLDPNQERVVTIKTKPDAKKEQAPEKPISSYSANLPQNILDLIQGEVMQQQKPMAPAIGQALQMLLGGAKDAFSGMGAPEIQGAMAQQPASPLQGILQSLGILQGQQPAPQGMAPEVPQFDPMQGQQPMDFSQAPGFNPYGG